MQPKNLSKSSPAKVAQVSQEEFNIKGDGFNLRINGKQIFRYIAGITGNCQIGSLAILESELLTKYLKSCDLDTSKRIIRFLFADCRRQRKMTFISFRTKFFTEDILELFKLQGDIVLNIEYFEERQKFTKLLFKILA